jgi:hypothetical protein
MAMMRVKAKKNNCAWATEIVIESHVSLRR